MYSFSNMKSERKPPLPKSPIRLRSRRPLQQSSNSTLSLQTPSGSLNKFQKSTRPLAIEESALRPEYQTISCEISALSKMVKEELGNAEKENFDSFAAGAASCGSRPGVLFERGRFYDEYSARRNERLRRKQGVVAVAEQSKLPAYSVGLGVTMESAKKYSSRKLGSIRKSVTAAYSMEMSEAQTPRYMLRSMTKEKETKKPTLAAVPKPPSAGRKIGTRRTTRI
ncbi:uncharacterized protein LOC130944186 [Arachis stenosperma]|uniref:uncharacterized protein LOC130944186 n=1 Tax=Arachis stenosperma TaxID=217475 RepID=UPI0025AC5D87|nr:uncharacterized protein LOC130944186 [Arachis stenosperma]